MKNSVIVTADATGNVIVKSEKNPDYGHIRVEQQRMIIDNSGFARRMKLSALIPGLVEDLKGFGWSANEAVEGKIIVRQSLAPFNQKDPERDYKIAGETGIVCCVDGLPMYRKNFYTPDSSAVDYDTDDEGKIVEGGLHHTNGDEIQAAYAASKEQAAIEPNEDFNL
jgi:hypothetical protein